MEHPVRLYFSFDENEEKSECLIDGCRAKLTGKHAANLTRHLQYHHPNEFTIVSMTKEQRKRRRTENSLTASSTSTTTVMMTALTAKSLTDACIELITVNGRPLNILEDSGLRKIIDPILQAIEPSPTINRANITDAIITKANIVRKYIKTEVNNKLISLKIDGVTRQFRSFIGINAQYIKDQKIVIRTLALKEIFDRHTSQNLKNLVIDVLKEYDLNIGNIYTITTDNGANMLKMIRLLKEELENCDETDDDFFNEYGDEFYLDNEELFPADGNNLELVGVRCVAHTLQLAVHDAIQSFNIKELLKKIRELVKKLRNTALGSALKIMNFRRPILDCATRWCSTFQMLERLISLKEFCFEINDTTLCEDEWNTINQLITALEPAKIATKKMQYEQLLMGDFYTVWIQCKLSLQKINSNFATLLLNSIKSREQEIINNKSLLASIFLDPRYKNLLSENEKSTAILHLMDTWKRYETLVSNNINDKPIENSILAPSDDIEKILLEKDAEQNSSNTAVSIVAALNAFSQIPRINREKNILQYWDKYSFFDLRILANIVHAVPATQVSVERLFSGLKFILNDQRSRLNCDILDDIMIIRTNSIE